MYRLCRIKKVVETAISRRVVSTTDRFQKKMAEQVLLLETMTRSSRDDHLQLVVTQRFGTWILLCGTSVFFSLSRLLHFRPSVLSAQSFGGRYTNKRLDLSFGHLRRPFDMTIVSNHSPTEEEFQRWVRQMDEDSMPLPSRAEIDKKVKVSFWSVEPKDEACVGHWTDGVIWSGFFAVGFCLCGV